MFQFCAWQAAGVRRHQAILIGHGALVLCFGLVAGFGFTFHLLGELSLWPVPGGVPVQIPGDPGRWRGAHVGGITNGLMAMAVGLALPVAALEERVERWVTWGIVGAVWGNVVFYVSNALGAANHGLSFGGNRLGPGDVLGMIGFFGAYPGAFVAPVMLVLLARGAFRAARIQRS